ncbi:MAG: GtrA family protein [Neobacillus sp.]
MPNLRKILIEIFPVRFLLFSVVGLIGMGIHMLTLGVFHLIINFHFLWAQTIATYVAMTSNYFINNNFTYRDQRIKGNKMLSGLISFYLVCSIGALINIASADLFYREQNSWIEAGVIGGIAGSIWNYYFSSKLTWKKNSSI